MFPEYGSHRWETAQRGDKGPDCCSFLVPLVCVQNVSSNIFLSSLVCLTVPKLVAECSWHVASQPWASGTHRELAHKVCLIVSGWGCSPGLGTQLWDACCRISSSLHPWLPHSFLTSPTKFHVQEEGKEHMKYLFSFERKYGVSVIFGITGRKLRRTKPIVGLSLKALHPEKWSPDGWKGEMRAEQVKN